VLAVDFEDQVARFVVTALELLGAAWLLRVAVASWRNRCVIEIRDGRVRADAGPVRVPFLVGRPIEVALDDIAGVTVDAVEGAFVTAVQTKQGEKVLLSAGTFDRSIPAFVARAIESAVAERAEPRGPDPR
jgi:hypothetical protein